jgi:CRISPR/Cas system type I-B associated protein Csh2 (Cas7 group RAMP superfamily)
LKNKKHSISDVNSKRVRKRLFELDNVDEVEAKKRATDEIKRIEKEKLKEFHRKYHVVFDVSLVKNLYLGINFYLYNI